MAWLQSLLLVAAAIAVGAWCLAVVSTIRLWLSLPPGGARWRLIWNGMDWFKAGTFPPAAAADRRRLVRAFIAFFAAIATMALLGGLFLAGR